MHVPNIFNNFMYTNVTQTTKFISLSKPHTSLVYVSWDMKLLCALTLNLFVIYNVTVQYYKASYFIVLYCACIWFMVASYNTGFCKKIGVTLLKNMVITGSQIIDQTLK